ncbi:MAG TPA: GNAT family N-acetyltransferase [Steroidobacteraceae bacterium]|nr:GNAT family N-acetyltransferase [Steroidobacteraceae bacterium]
MTPRLRLRAFSAGDADHLVSLDADPCVMRYISRGAPTSRDQIVDQILPRWIAGYVPGSCIGYWAIERADSAEFIGWVHLRPDRFTPEDMELGYRFVRRVWGAGLATEASTALLDRGFRGEGVASVSSRTLMGNRASRRVMEKCGLEYRESFVYPPEMLVGWSLDERRAVKYDATRAKWLSWSGGSLSPQSSPIS